MYLVAVILTLALHSTCIREKNYSNNYAIQLLCLLVHAWPLIRYEAV